MKLLMTVEQRFDATSDGAVWVQTACTYGYLARPLEVFDAVKVAARMRPIPEVPTGSRRADGDGVTIIPVPYYLGPWQYLTKYRRVVKAAVEAFEYGDAVILFGGSPISHTIETMLRRNGYPYGVVVAADPYDVFAPGAVVHPLRAFFRWWTPTRLRSMCRGACAACYVTEYALQKRYPCPARAFGVSDVLLTSDAFAAEPRVRQDDHGCRTVISVGNLAQLYKAPDVLIQAMAGCIRDGLDLRLVLVGDGQFRPRLEAMAEASGITERVKFTGSLSSGAAVREELDKADLFVLPSRQEGLPRAMVEAMARALPCIGSQVGGIPELLQTEDMVRPDDVAGLKNSIKSVLTDPDRMARMSARNLERARDFAEELLRERRLEFFKYVRERTEEWLRTKSA